MNQITLKELVGILKNPENKEYVHKVALFGTSQEKLAILNDNKKDSTTKIILNANSIKAIDKIIENQKKDKTYIEITENKTFAQLKDIHDQYIFIDNLKEIFDID